MLFTVSVVTLPRPLSLLASSVIRPASCILYRTCLCISGPPNIDPPRICYCPKACCTCKKRRRRRRRISPRRAYVSCRVTLSCGSCRCLSRSNCRGRNLWRARSLWGGEHRHIAASRRSSLRYYACSTAPSPRGTTTGRPWGAVSSFTPSENLHGNPWCPQGQVSAAAWCCWPSFYV